MNIRPLILFCLICTSSYAQFRVEKLVIKADTTFALLQDQVLVADTLILNNNSQLILNPAFGENYLYVKVLLVEGSATIMGNGTPGPNGRQGRKGQNTGAPCQRGGDGSPGIKGLDGRDGVNLYLTFEQLNIRGSLQINLNGGNGGHGGNGGEGGSGSNGTLVCKGGIGGNGGNGAPGGNGGRGGKVVIKNRNISSVRAQYGNKLLITNFGGLPGTGGNGGVFGYGGENPRGGKASHGIAGTTAASGRKGEPGEITFEPLNP